MDREVYWNEGLDIRRLALALGRRLWLVFIGIAAGALLGAACYRLITGITNGQPEYRATSDYYISFDLEQFPNGVDYYNAYTWDSILRDDPIVDYALALLPEGITKEEVQASVSGEMLGDYRILTVHVTTPEPGLTERIAAAYHQAMAHFGEQLDMLKAIEVWSRGEAALLEKNTRTPNAAFLGGLLGGLSSLFGLCVYLLLEDAFYVEKEVSDRFGLPVYGLLTRGKDPGQEAIYRTNLEFVFGKKEPIIWKAGELPTAEDYERLRKEEAILVEIPWGKPAGACTKRLLSLMSLQKCSVGGFLMTGAQDSFVRAYYWGKNRAKTGAGAGNGQRGKEK